MKRFNESIIPGNSERNFLNGFQLFRTLPIWYYFFRTLVSIVVLEIIYVKLTLFGCYQPNVTCHQNRCVWVTKTCNNIPIKKIHEDPSL